MSAIKRIEKKTIIIIANNSHIVYHQSGYVQSPMSLFLLARIRFIVHSLHSYE